MMKTVAVFVFLSFIFINKLFSQTYLAPVQDPTTMLWGYIDLEGNLIIPYKFIYAEEFSEGLALVFEECSDLKKAHSHYIDSKGNVIIDLTNSEEGSKFDMWGTFEYEKGKFNFYDGMACFVNSENKWGFINKEGEFAIPCQYDEAGIFSESVAYAVINGKMTGYIAKDGSWAVALDDKRFLKLYDECNCIYSGQPFSNGVAVMSVVGRTQECTNYETILINKNGEIIYQKANSIGNFKDADLIEKD